MSTTTIRLPQDLKQRVTQAAEKAGTSSHALILDAIAQRIDEEERRSDFYETAENRFTQIATSGETIPWEKMRSYLENQVSDKKADRPVSRKITT